MSQKLNLLYFARCQFKAEICDDPHKFIIDLCMELKLISDKYECPTCSAKMYLQKRKKSNDGYEWACRKSKPTAHYMRRSIRCGSWFENCKKPMIDILMLTECFVAGRTQKDTMNLLNVTSATVCDWRHFFRELCFEIAVADSTPIGGPDIIVEIKQSKYGRRKLNKGKVEEKWVFGGVEMGTTKCFFKIVEQNDKETLLELVKEYILPGTTVYSDCWQSFNCLQDEEFQNFSVNYCVNFACPEIAGAWSAIERKLPSIASDLFHGYLGEYIWQKNNANSGDLMLTFLEGVRRVYPPKERD